MRVFADKDLTTTDSIVSMLEGLESLNSNLVREYNILKHQFLGINANGNSNQVKG